MVTSGSMANALSRPFGGARLRHDVGQLDLAAHRLLDGVADAGGAACFVFVAFELARHRDGVEREPVGRGVDLGVDDVGAGKRAGAGDDRKQPWMVGREYRKLGDAALGVEADRGRQRLAGGFRRAHEARMRELVRQIDLEPIGRVVPRRYRHRARRPANPCISARNSACAMATRWARLTSENPPVSTGSVS